MNTNRRIWIRILSAVLALGLLCAWSGNGNTERGIGLEGETNPGVNVRVWEDDSPGYLALIIELRTPAEHIIQNPKGEDVILTPGFGRYGEIGQPLLPHQQITVALPPNVDLQSLRLDILDMQTERLSGRYNLQIAEEPPAGCALTPNILGPSGRLTEVQPETCAIPDTGASPEMKSNPFTFSFTNQGDWLNSPYWAQAPGLLHVLRTGAMRKWRFAILDFAPYTVEDSSGVVQVVRQAQARLSYNLDPQADLRPDYAAGLRDTVMDDRAATAFVNYEMGKYWYEQAATDLQIQTPDVDQYDYVIITSSDIVANSTKLSEFVAHKEARGHKVWVVTETTFFPYIGPPPNRTAERIRAFLQSNYLTHGFHYVLLIGDPDPDNPYIDGPTDPFGDIPMKMCYANTILAGTLYTDTPTDMYYADLNGNWNPDGDAEFCSWYDFLQNSGIDLWADVIVGRIPLAKKNPRDYAGLDAILKKTMDYQNGLHHGDWQRSVLLPISFFKGDIIAGMWDTAGLGEQIEDFELTTRGFSSWKMYMQGTNPCAYDSIYNSDEELLDGATLTRLQTSPFGVILWYGHGSATDALIGCGTGRFGEPYDCWSGRILNVADTASLDNDHPAFVFQVSCLNGQPEVPDNLQTSLLKIGAVAAVGASRVTTPLTPELYGEFGMHQSSPGLGYNFVKWVAMDADAGDALAIARELWVPYWSAEYLNVLAFNLYGDPETYLGAELSVAPETPTNLQLMASYYNDRSVVLHWDDNSEIEESMIIERLTYGGTWEPVKEVPSDVVQTSVPGNDCGTIYRFRVKAHNAIGDSGYSNEVHFSGFTCAPNPPVNVTAAPFPWLEGNVLIEWNTGGGQVSFYKVQRRRFGLFSHWANLATITVNFPSTILDQNIDCGTHYSYRVIACGTGGCSLPSQTAGVTTDCAPAAPINLNASSTAYHVSLGWNDISDRESGYMVSRALTEYLEWRLLEVLQADSNNFLDEGVLCDLDYTYMVSAFSSRGHNSSTVDTHTLACPLPSVPTGLTVDTVILSETGLDISWTDNNVREWGYKIERSPSGLNNWVEVGAVKDNETRYHDHNLVCGTSYDYRVRAYNTYTSNPSAVATGSTFPCNMNGPIHLNATPVSKTQIDLEWEDGSLFGATHYDIIRTLNPNKQPWAPLATVAGDTFYHDQGLNCNTEYFYRVRARSVNPPIFTSAYTEPITAITVMCVPEEPSEVELVSGATDSIGLLWLDTSNTEQGFTIERYREDLSLWEQLGSTGAEENFFMDTGLDCGTAYQYRVHAFNAGGDSSPSEIATLNSAICIPTGASALTTTRSTQTSIGLNWNDNSINESGFSLSRSDALGIIWQEIGETGENEASYVDTSVTCGRTYTYRVASFNDGGSSLASSPVLANSQVCTPNLSAQALFSGVIGLTWTDDSQIEGGYSIYRKSSLEGIYTKIASLDANTESYNDGNASCLMGYSYKVCAEIPGTANSACSAVQSVHTTCLPQVPSALSAELAGPNQIQLSWTDNSSNESGFIILRSDNDGEGWIELGRVSNNVTQFLDLGLEFNHLYLYRVAAYSAGGTSGYSNQADVQTAIELFFPICFK
jgi:fibronectin type 3 domain-containing protein